MISQVATKHEDNLDKEMGIHKTTLSSGVAIVILSFFQHLILHVIVFEPDIRSSSTAAPFVSMEPAWSTFIAWCGSLLD